MLDSTCQTRHLSLAYAYLLFGLQVFSAIYLVDPDLVPTLGPTTDPDNLIQCDLMDGRDAFLSLARARHLEFSSHRRAVYSSKCLAYDLHHQGQQTKFFYNCDKCRGSVERRYHCLTCDVSEVDFIKIIACLPPKFMRFATRHCQLKLDIISYSFPRLHGWHDAKVYFCAICVYVCGGGGGGGGRACVSVLLPYFHVSSTRVDLTTS